MGFLIIDFEAVRDVTGKFFPIEVGLCLPGSSPISALIKPEPNWRADECRLFDEGLFREAQQNGLSAAFVSERLEKLTTGHHLVSDATFLDQSLLSLLSPYGRSEPMLEFFPWLQNMAAEKGVDKSMFNRWINEIDESRESAHRAGEDARCRADLVWKVLCRR